MKITAEPRSDQLNADDFVSGPKTFKITGTVPGKAEQKYDIELEGEARCWRPPPTVVRLIMAAWGDESDDWIGKRVTLYRDTTVKFGPNEVGGVRLSHMSDLPGNRPLKESVTNTRGKRSKRSIEPLLDDGTPTITADLIAEFQSRITDAASTDDLSQIAADLKTWDLGTHRSTLQTAWGQRRQQLAEGTET